MGVGVVLGGPAVGGPSGVAHAQVAGHGIGPQFGVQAAELALGPHHLQFMAVQDGQAGRVITPVFQTAQTVHDDLDRVPRPHVSDNPAHNS